MMKNNILKYIIVLIIGLIAGIMIISAFKSSPDMSSYERKLDSLSTVIDTNNIRIARQDTNIFYFKKHISHLDSQYVSHENRINKLNKDKNVKIKAVDNMSNDSLFKSISNRYK